MTTLMLMFTKRQAIDAALTGGGPVMVLMDPRRQGVVVPERFLAEKTLALVVGLNLPRPVTDLTVNEGFMRATLAFGAENFTCIVPMTAVYGIRNGEQLLYWPLDAPKDQEELAQAAPVSAVPNKRAHLKLVD